MDQRLLAWGRAVKQRQRSRRRTIWLFTDPRHLADPLPAIAALPKLYSGVIFRHDAAPNRAILAAKIARLCKARGIALAIAGDARLAAMLHTGIHLRGGRWPGLSRVSGLITSSAHNIPEIRRAAKAGAQLIFLSPAFASASHPGTPALGAHRWAATARGSGQVSLLALGGVSGATIKSLGSQAGGAAAISALTV